MVEPPPHSLTYGLHRVQEFGELVETARAGCGILPLASDDTIEFLDVVHPKFIKEFLILQAVHWNWHRKKEQKAINGEAKSNWARAHKEKNMQLSSIKGSKGTITGSNLKSKQTSHNCRTPCFGG